MGVAEHRFESAGAMQQAVYNYCLPLLQQALDEHQCATLLLAGGQTPLGVYRQLAEAALSWSRLQLALVDERWVAPDHAASNEGAVRRCFASNSTALQQMVAMFDGASSPQAALAACNLRYANLQWPASLGILGMGSDGHMASLFPAAVGLENALASDALCAAISATPSAVTGPFTERMSLTLHALLQCRQWVLMITGEEKWQVYQRAKTAADKRAPISLLLQQVQALAVFWSP